MELYKSLDEEQTHRLLEILNEWFTHNEFPTDQFYSMIVLIYKKGNASDVLNYRPIALTNSV